MKVEWKPNCPWTLSLVYKHKFRLSIFHLCSSAWRVVFIYILYICLCLKLRMHMIADSKKWWEEDRRDIRLGESNFSQKVGKKEIASKRLSRHILEVASIVFWAGLIAINSIFCFYLFLGTSDDLIFSLILDSGIHSSCIFLWMSVNASAENTLNGRVPRREEKGRTEAGF